MDEQMIQQTIIVPQGAINPNRTVERKSFFNEAGEPVMVVNANNEAYIEPELLTGWEPVDDPGIGVPLRPRYFKDATGIVWVDIYAQMTEDRLPNFDTPTFNLPVGYRPDVTIMRMGMVTSFANSPEAVVLMIFANGNVVLPSVPTDPTSDKLVAGFSIRPV